MLCESSRSLPSAIDLRPVWRASERLETGRLVCETGILEAGFVTGAEATPGRRCCSSPLPSRLERAARRGKRGRFFSPWPRFRSPGREAANIVTRSGPSARFRERHSTVARPIPGTLTLAPFVRKLLLFSRLNGRFVLERAPLLLPRTLLENQVAACFENK